MINARGKAGKLAVVHRTVRMNPMLGIRPGSLCQTKTLVLVLLGEMGFLPTWSWLPPSKGEMVGL
jgi:hypothetical protein